MTDTAAPHAIVVHTLLAIAALFGGSFVLLVVFRARRAILVRGATLLAVMLVTLAAASGGPLVFALFVLLLVMLALSELWRVVDAAGTPPYRHSGSLAAAGLVAAAFWRGSAALAPVTALAIAALLCRGFLSGQRAGAVHRVGATLLGVGYVGLLGAFLVLLRTDVGLGAVVFFVAVIQIADVSAFFGGTAVGRRALAPSLSPGKTWEGMLAGVLGGIVAALVFRFALPELSTVAAVMSGAVFALTGLAGDLVASGFKREAGVKDFGGILPGHGGILDRFDGCFMAAPVAWLLLRPWSLS